MTNCSFVIYLFICMNRTLDCWRLAEQWTNMCPHLLRMQGDFTRECNSPLGRAQSFLDEENSSRKRKASHQGRNTLAKGRTSQSSTPWWKNSASKKRWWRLEIRKQLSGQERTLQKSALDLRKSFIFLRTQHPRQKMSDTVLHTDASSELAMSKSPNHRVERNLGNQWRLPDRPQPVP